MKKTYFILIILLVSIGLIGVALLEIVLADNHEECSCCGNSCQCRPQICTSGCQPKLFVDSEKNILIGLVFKEFFCREFDFTYKKKLVRRIFHPPRYL